MVSNSQNNWDRFALLLIDVQNDFWNEQIAEAFPDFKQNVSNLLTFCRQQGIEVIHLRARFQADKSDWMPIYKLGRYMPCVDGTDGVALLEQAIEIPGELVIEKQCFDSFLTEELEPHLRRYDRRFLLTAGLVTSICVLLTTLAAMQRGFLTAIVEDCCGDKPSAHEHTLERYDFMFERTSVNEIAEKYQRWQKMIEQLET